MARFDSSDRLDAGLRFDEAPVVVQPPTKRSKLMSLFNLALKSKTVAEKLTMGGAHIAAMTGNTHYPPATRVPTDAQKATAQAELQTAADEADAAEIVWKQKNAVRNVKEDIHDQVMTAAANNCEAVTPGDVAALTSTGFPMKGAPQPPVHSPQAPSTLDATAGTMEGTVNLKWSPIKGSAMTVVEFRAQGAPAWTNAGQLTQSKFTVTGLTPGTLYDFRVHGLSKTGEPGPMSDIALVRAP